jgi:nucleoside-diphosphate-sugar epimerase
MKAFVTGGGGFVGGAIVRLLRARGDEVVSYSRSLHAAVEELGARCVQGDIADGRKLRDAMRGSDAVFHVAAKAGVWGSRAEYARTNVDGTRAVLAAALESRVPRFVFTSSPSVCFDGRDHVNASNDQPYARRFLAAYPETKAEAEKLVLAANGSRGIATVALRPHLVFGPGDPHLIPRILDRARRGKLLAVGDRRNRVSLTYVDTAAQAHVDACDRLEPGAVHAGRAYFIAQSEPVVLWSWIDELLAHLALPPIRRRVPLATAYVAGAACEVAWRALARTREPPMTRFLALQLARSHTYDMSSARDDFGWVERVSMHAATERTIAWWRDQLAGAGGGGGASVLGSAGAFPVASHERA